jgi:glycolate oxidase
VNQLVKDISSIVGEKWIIWNEDKELYSYDAFTLIKGEPSLVILPGNEEEAIKVIRYLLSKNIKFTIRGSGTSLSGATVPTQGEVVVVMTRLNRIYEVKGMEITVGPGIANIMVTKNSPPWLFYAPDPSSYVVSSIGGNISHDSGGIHALKYGTTVNNVVALRVLLPDGNVEDIGRVPFLDPTPIFIGAEGTLGAILRVTLRLVPKPFESKTIMGVFPDIRSAANAVVDTFKAGIMPAAMEMMDRNSIYVVEKSKYKANYPDAGAILIIEIDGFGVDEYIEKEKEVILHNQGYYILPRTEEEVQRIWRGRKGAFPAMGVLSSAYITLDCNVPRSKLPEVLSKIYEIGERRGLFIANVFHAGDGNLHPLIAYDPSKRESVINALEASAEIVRIALENGGVISGEHGIGIEKVRFMEYYYSQDDILQMRKIKEIFDPKKLLNPCKFLPTLEECKANDEYLRILYSTPWEVT